MEKNASGYSSYDTYFSVRALTDLTRWQQVPRIDFWQSAFGYIVHTPLESFWVEFCANAMLLLILDLMCTHWMILSLILGKRCAFLWYRFWAKGNIYQICDNFDFAYMHYSFHLALANLQSWIRGHARLLLFKCFCHPTGTLQPARFKNLSSLLVY